MSENHIICPKCHTQIIRNKKTCYRCGNELQINKKNTRAIAVLSAISLLIISLIIFAISCCTDNPKDSIKNNATTSKATAKKNIRVRKTLIFFSFNFIKTDLSETTVRAFITEKGFAAVPLEYFNNIKEIVWKENGKAIVIDSGIYWQPDAPFLLLKIPYENQDNPRKITKWDPARPVFWRRDNSEIPEVILKPTVSTTSENYYTEIDFSGNNGSGLFTQGKHIVGWTFIFLKNKGYLWTGVNEHELKPNIELNTLELLLNNNLQAKIKEGSIKEAGVLMTIKNLSCFFTDSNPSKNWDPIIISLLNKVCLNGITEKKYHEVLSIITLSLLAKSQDIILLDCYTKANEAIYGYDLTISLLEKLRSSNNATLVFSNKIISLIIKSYIQWGQELLYYGKYDDAIKMYSIAMAQYPSEQDLKIFGIETYIKMNNWQKAEEILSGVTFDSKYIPKLQELKNTIEVIKASENKIIIKFSPNAQRNIFVNGVINGEISQKFILDTGASIVSIPLATANKLGIDIISGDYTPRIIATASGIFKTKEVILHSITINGKNIYNIPAIVIDLPQDRSLGLLGMNFLSRFHMELNNDNGEIILTPKE